MGLAFITSNCCTGRKTDESKSELRTSIVRSFKSVNMDKSICNSMRDRETADRTMLPAGKVEEPEAEDRIVTELN